MESKINLQRFLIAQDGERNGRTLYENALIEIQEGRLSFECWIRYVYPQLKRKRTSKLTDYYGLNGREEAQAYIEHPILRERLIKAAQTLLTTNVYETFSPLGVLKVKSCMQLFSTFSVDPIFKQIINKYSWK